MGLNAQQRCVPTFGEAVVGTITLSRQQGSLTANMPFEVGRQDQLLVKNGSTVALRGGPTWGRLTGANPG